MKEEVCRTCGSKLIKRETQKKPSQLRKQYYYTAYYYCPKCRKIYLNDKFKVVNDIQDELLFPPEENAKDTNIDVEIWTDGACVFNGRHNARAAWGFVSGKTEKAGLVEGKQTNNVAEALAIYHAILWAVENKHRKIRIHSDSQITINNMKKPPGAIKQNREIFENIAGLIHDHSLKVRYEKVLGHSGDINNERADKLAADLAGKAA